MGSIGRLDVDLSDLIDTEHPKFTKTYGEQEVALEEHDWIKLLQGEPEVRTWPILVNGNQIFTH